MAFDAYFMNAVLKEIRQVAMGAKVEKIHQPARDTVILHLRHREGRCKLLFGMNPTAPRLHLTAANPENPPEPPMFCMLLRKHLSGGRLVEISQPPMERCAELTFECMDEMGHYSLFTNYLEGIKNGKNRASCEKLRSELCSG